MFCTDIVDTGKACPLIRKYLTNVNNQVYNKENEKEELPMEFTPLMFWEDLTFVFKIIANLFRKLFGLPVEDLREEYESKKNAENN